ncbi:uncharacterized protein LOC111692403 [Anoplophora glabripennis]|uniref:uncharacterized protein LOC111692403 n=1 Tax=Anoplophora glabripennis TaxID=217634 RepID=UPI000C779EB5|nr:uncharacterized protein LOC111692403 [Anoplophora glabripennis]
MYNRYARENYGDNAVGWVQVKRDGDVCIVKARVTPEQCSECYWKNSALSNIDTNLKLVKVEDLGETNPLKTTNDTNFLQSFVNHSLDLGITDTVLMKYFKEESDFERLSLHRLLEEYLVELEDITADGFSTFCTGKMTEDICRCCQGNCRSNGECFMA